MPEVTVTMPLVLTTEMIRAVRDNPLTKVDDLDEWHTRLGWLICAWDVLVEMRLPLAQPVCGNCGEAAPGCSGLFANDGTACQFHGNPSPAGHTSKGTP